MRRREFLGLMGGAVLAGPLVAHAQQGERVRRIGMLGSGEVGSNYAALIDGLKGLGWIEGRNIGVVSRFALGDPALFRTYARELLDLSPDVIVAGNPVAISILMNHTRSIPIVFATSSDPVGQGFVESLARPGGIVTGFTSFEFSMGGKWIELLKEVAPSIGRVAVMFNSETAPYMGSFLRFIESAARSFTVSVKPALIREPRDIEPAINMLARESGLGLIFPADAFTTAHAKVIAESVADHRVPAVYSFRHFTPSGGLMSYGIDVADNFRRAAGYVDRILKGAKPADLPVQQPNVFQLVINLKAAKALGLTVPPMLLARADEVIE